MTAAAITVDQLPPKMAANIRMDLCDVPGLHPFCWTWTAGGNGTGYGWISFSRDDRGLTHRYAYTLLIGPIPDGLEIDHLCRNRRCCNPLHLDPVTTKVNQERGIRATSTHCQRGLHELTGYNLILKVRKSGHVNRECRACKYESQRRSVARRQASGLPDGHQLHGSITGYLSYACRCAPCRAAGSESNARAAARRAARRQVAA